MKITIADIITSLLIVLFTYTAISKFSSPYLFEKALSGINGKGVALFAILIPMLESGIVLLLLFQATRLLGLYASLAALSAFTLFLVYMVLFEPALPCSCGGVISSMGWVEHIVFNLVFIILSIIAIRIYKSQPLQLVHAR